MCMQDIAISRSAELRRTLLPTSVGVCHVGNNPDRIAVILIPYAGSNCRVYLSDDDYAGGYTYKDNRASEIISATSVGALDTYVTGGTQTGPARPLQMSVQSDPGIVSAAFLVDNQLSNDTIMWETILAPDVSKAVQEIV